MKIEYVYDAIDKVSLHVTDTNDLPAELIEYAMWSSEIYTFDPMEKAIHNLYKEISTYDRRT